MCGIVGYLGRQNAAPLLLEGLTQLEYRGYDSAGIAVLGRRGCGWPRQQGRVRELAASMPKRFTGKVGHRPHPVGHPWGAFRRQRPPAPRRDRTVAVVHNGIIDNAAELRRDARRRRCQDGVRNRHGAGRPPRRALARQDTLEEKPSWRPSVRSRAPTGWPSCMPTTRTGSWWPATALR